MNSLFFLESCFHLITYHLHLLNRIIVKLKRTLQSVHHMSGKGPQTKLKYNQKLVHLSAILLCLATEQPLK